MLEEAQWLPSRVQRERERWHDIRKLADTQAIPALVDLRDAIRTKGIGGSLDEKAMIFEGKDRGRRFAVYNVRWDLVEPVDRTITSLSSRRRRSISEFTSKGVGIIVSEDKGLEGVCFSSPKGWQRLKGKNVGEDLNNAIKLARPMMDTRYGRGLMSYRKIPVNTITNTCIDAEFPG